MTSCKSFRNQNQNTQIVHLPGHYTVSSAEPHHKNFCQPLNVIELLRKKF